MLNRNFCKKVLAEGGRIIPLLIDPKDSKGLGLMNPSILLDNSRLLLNLRNINYTLYHCEGEQLFNNRWGPLSYLHPENDMHLRTFNFMCDLNLDTLEIEKYCLTDTTDLDKPPLWDFVGLEDARLVRWEGKLYQCGVRRDTTPNGVGRMELSEIIEVGKDGEYKWKEISRVRIEPPNNANTYCEKNWMPILDMPYHFVKWSNPTEVVKVNYKVGTSETIYLGKSHIPNVRDFRGGSQVVKWKSFRVAMIHEVNLFNNKLEQKDATYFHRFLVWDDNWNLIKMSEPFSFMDGEIEFGCGLTFFRNKMLVTFGFQDNAAFVLEIPEHLIEETLGFKKGESSKIEKYSLIGNFNEIKIKNKNKQDPTAKWKSSKWPTLEITTIIPEKGCINNCVFCPQNVLINSYKGERILSLENFKRAIDKVPEDVTIIFSGFSEPWMNKDTTEMVLYAHSKKHPIAIFTSGIGMTKEDIDKIKHINFSLGAPNPTLSTKKIPMQNGGFNLHLPDNEGYAKHPITQKYIELLEYIKSIQHEIVGFRPVCMGNVHEKIKHIWDSPIILDIWWRAGNLSKEEQYKPELIELRDKIQKRYVGELDITCGCDEGLYHNILLPNGDVVLCCMDYSLNHVLGNLFNQEYNDIIPAINTPFTICRYCENGIPVNLKI